MKSMIYYPGFEVKNQSWLKLALLYFDELRPIIPYTILSEEQYLSETFFKIRNETDLIRVYRPSIEETNIACTMALEEFTKYLNNPEIYRGYFGNSIYYLEKWKNSVYQDCKLFEGKYSTEFFHFCKENKIATACNEGIRISSDLVFVYMTFLADVISKIQGYEMITDVDKYSNFLIKKEIERDYAKNKKLEFIKNSIKDLLPENLNEIPLETFINLRKSRDFCKIRKAYISEVEKLFYSKEQKIDYSENIKLSFENEIKNATKNVLFFLEYATITAFNCKNAFTEGKPDMLAFLTAAISFKDVAGSYKATKDNLGHIKDIHYSRRYVASIKKIR